MAREPIPGGSRRPCHTDTRRIPDSLRPAAPEELVPHQALTANADAEVRAAARSLADAATSRNPREQLLRAIGYLCSAYEKYQDRAVNSTSSLADRVRAAFNQSKAVHARYRAAETALLIAQIYWTVGDDDQTAIWRDRAREDCLASNEAVLLRKTAQLSAITSHTPGFCVSYDYAEYQRLRRELEDACTALT